MVYDFKINDKKIQEKIGHVVDKIIQFGTFKANGINSKQSYIKNDNDFYWLNCPDKEHFLIIPEKYIINKTTLSIDLRVLDSNFKNKQSNTWWTAFLYKYSEITEEKIINSLQN